VFGDWVKDVKISRSTLRCRTIPFDEMVAVKLWAIKRTGRASGR
jgi:hypothetical protein